MNINGRSFAVKSSAIGARAMNCGLKDSGYDGDFFIAVYDELTNLTEKRAGTISNGHCVNDYVVIIGDTQYTGHFDENGHSTEEQPDGVGGVAYAYDGNQNNYLLAKDADINKWVADLEFVGIEENK